jgi:hypothetical protein
MTRPATDTRQRQDSGHITATERGDHGGDGLHGLALARRGLRPTALQYSLDATVFRLCNGLVDYEARRGAIVLYSMFT